MPGDMTHFRLNALQTIKVALRGGRTICGVEIIIFLFISEFSFLFPVFGVCLLPVWFC